MSDRDDLNDGIGKFTRQNRRAWNEIATVREKIFPPAEFFKGGGSTLGARTVAAAGDIRGRRILHLQCATGEDTLSWAVLGADAVGVDISDQQIDLARRKAQEAGLNVRFEAADVYALPPDIASASFDFVFTGGGALVWLPDIWRWAEVVHSCLKPGGCLLLDEEHPLAPCLWQEEGRLVVTDDYFSRSRALEGSGWTHFSADFARENKYEFIWPLGDIITALARTGLFVERLEEYPGGAKWRFGSNQDALRLPGEMLLVARKHG